MTNARFQKLDTKYGNNRMEVWHYDPALLTQTNEVDKLSLYLSMQGEEDERIYGALTGLINEIKW